MVQAYAYSSFGKLETQLDPAFVQPYTYTARELDRETGLYYYRSRYYDANMGRFLQEDPLRLAGNNNFYAYVENNPLVFSDPEGTAKIKGVTKEPVFVHKFDPDSTPRVHGHVGSPTSPIRVDADTGEFYHKSTPTGKKLPPKKLATFRRQLKKLGLLGLAVIGFELLFVEDLTAAVETLGDAIVPFGLIKGDLAPGDVKLPALCPVPPNGK